MTAVCLRIVTITTREILYYDSHSVMTQQGPCQQESVYEAKHSRC